MGSGKSEGANAAYDAAKAAIDSPLLDNISINGAMGVLVHFHIHPDYPILQISEAMETIEDHAHEDANVIFGTTTNSNMAIDEVKITIVATGFSNNENVATEEAEKAKKAGDLLSGMRGNVTTPKPSTMQTRRVVGGYESENEDILEVPTFLRKQMD